MRYLAINTAVKTEALISVNSGDYYFSSPEKSLAGSQLLPQIDLMLNEAGVTLNDLDFLACVIGPGSFTGIRIGVSTIRALSYALNKPIIPINYFDVMAYNSSAPFTTAINGGNGVCYIKNYAVYSPATDCRVTDTTLKTTDDDTLSYVGPDIASQTSSDDYPVCVKIADIKEYAYKTIIGDSFFSELVTRIIQDGAVPFKAAVEKAAAQNNFTTYDKLQPLYLRRSQPEREKGEL